MRKPKLGFCSYFHVEKYQLSEVNDVSKPLMYFEGTPTNLGCTILLTGASVEELKVIKLHSTILSLNIFCLFLYK
jgi:1-phosphatidylinositol-3-phosphate 5-kinase